MIGKAGILPRTDKVGNGRSEADTGCKEGQG